VKKYASFIIRPRGVVDRGQVSRQHLDPPAAGFFDRHPDGGERGLQVTHQREVVHRDHRDLRWNVHAGQVSGPHGADRGGDVRDHHRGGRMRGLPVAQQPEHDAQLILGRPADRLDRFQRGARLLRALARQAPTPAWTVITARACATTLMHERASAAD
jgi:hypothetical protein